jgi:hypothetical protein
MIATAMENELLRDVIRGKQSWTALDGIGIHVTLANDRCQVDNPRQISYAATLEDLAQGVMRFRDAPEDLRRWAWFVQSSPSIYELAIEEDIRGERFREALWDQAFGSGANSQLIEMAADILEQATG